jgi:glycosyltransferase involved in cell wall biosynthesis
VGVDDRRGAVALHVCTRYQRGGSERRIRDVVDALPEVRHHLLLGADSDVELARVQTSAERVWTLPSLVRQVSPRHDAAAAAQLWRLLRQGGYDVVVTHQSKAGAIGRMAAAAAGGLPVVHSLSMASFGPGYGRAESAVFRNLERALGSRTAAFCVVGSDLAGRFAAVGVPADRLHVARSGVPLPSHVRPREEARRLVGDRYGLPTGRPLLCYVGSLEPRKNVVQLADVLARLGSRPGLAASLLVVGDGPQRAALEERLLALGVRRQAVLTGHVSDREHVSDALRAADLVLLLSRAEGLPQVLVQSAAVGTPFVSFDVEGVRELIALGAAGAAVPLGDLHAVVDAAAAQLVAGRATAREPVADLSSWSPERIRSAYRAAFAGVLSRPGRGDRPDRAVSAPA